jgi:hypothetical protein
LLGTREKTLNISKKLDTRLLVEAEPLVKRTLDTPGLDAAPCRDVIEPIV